MINLTPSLYYSTYLDGECYRSRAVVDVQALADALPHGSGINGDWTIEIRPNGAVRVYGDYHCMNEDGFYSGWRNFWFEIRRARTDKLHPLTGPCAGKVQVIHRKGDLIWTGVCGAGMRTGDLGDYLHEIIYDALREAKILPAPRMETINAAS